MARNLELIFTNDAGRTVRISIEAPQEPVDTEQVAAVMNDIISRNALTSAGGDLVGIRGARIVERTVEEVELDLEQ